MHILYFLCLVWLGRNMATALITIANDNSNLLGSFARMVNVGHEILCVTSCSESHLLPLAAYKGESKGLLEALCANVLMNERRDSLIVISTLLHASEDNPKILFDMQRYFRGVLEEKKLCPVSDLYSIQYAFRRVQESKETENIKGSLVFQIHNYDYDAIIVCNSWIKEKSGNCGLSYVKQCSENFIFMADRLRVVNGIESGEGMDLPDLLRKQLLELGTVTGASIITICWRGGGVTCSGLFPKERTEGRGKEMTEPCKSFGKDLPILQLKEFEYLLDFGRIEIEFKWKNSRFFVEYDQGSMGPWSGSLICPSFSIPIFFPACHQMNLEPSVFCIPDSKDHLTDLIIPIQSVKNGPLRDIFPLKQWMNLTEHWKEMEDGELGRKSKEIQKSKSSQFKEMADKRPGENVPHKPSQMEEIEIQWLDKINNKPLQTNDQKKSQIKENNGLVEGSGLFKRPKHENLDRSANPSTFGWKGQGEDEIKKPESIPFTLLYLACICGIGGAGLYTLFKLFTKLRNSLLTLSP